MSFDTDKTAIEKNIREAKAIVEMSKALERLEGNKDFKAVITQGYFKDEAVRLVHLKSDPSMQIPERQAGIISAIDAIGNLSAHLLSLHSAADRAQKAIDAGNEAIEEISAEEAAQ